MLSGIRLIPMTSLLMVVVVEMLQRLQMNTKGQSRR